MEDFEREGRAAYMRAYRKTPRGKIAVAKAQKKCRQAHREYYSDYQKLHSYDLALRKKGMTTDDYAEIFIKQGGKCAACGKESPLRAGKPCRLCVDHDHATGKVRGLLCWRCNMALGNMGDDPEILRQLLDYLTRPA